MNQFVDYLNAMNNASGDTTAALAESQVQSEYFRKIQIKRNLGTYLAKRIRSGEKIAVVLTGHAGDGKTSILVQVLQELEMLPEGKALLAEEYFEKDGIKLYAVKDMSELSEEQQITYCRKALDAPRNGQSSIIISNTGPLLKCLEQICQAQCTANGTEFGEREKIDLQNKLLEQLDKNENKVICVGDYCFLMINIARVDNVGFAKNILKKILADELWQPCTGCAKCEKCPIYFNVRQLRKYGDRVCALIDAFYRYLYENEQRMTIRQIMSQLSFALTGNLTCSDIKLSGRSRFHYLFSNLFFGYKGFEEIPNADQIQGIAYAKNLKLDAKGLLADYKLFVTGDFRDFPSEIGDLVRQQYTIFSRKHLNVDEKNMEFSEDDYEYRKAIRRAYIFFASPDPIETTYLPLFDELFGTGYNAYIRMQNGDANRKLQNDLLKTITQALYLEMTGTSSKQANDIPLTIKRSDDSFQSVMITTGSLKRNDFKLTTEPITNDFEDGTGRYDVSLQICGKEKFKLTLPMMIYFGEIASGMISTISNPSLTHGISKLKATLERMAAKGNDENEVAIIVNRTDKPMNVKISIDDKLYFE